MRAMRNLALLLLLAVATTASAQTGLDSVLARPVSPANDVMLVGHGREARVQARWSGALAHPEAETRSAVARLIQMAGATDLVDAVAAQLRVETDLGAAVELAETLTAIAGRVEPDTRAALARFGGPVAASVVTTLARVAPAQLLAELPGLRSPGPDADLALARVLRLWQETASPHGARLRAALMRVGDEASWRIVMHAAVASRVPLPPGIIVSALAARQDDVTTLALAYVVSLDSNQLAAVRDAAGIVSALDTVLTSLDARTPSTRLLATLASRRLQRPTVALDVTGVASALPKGSVPRRMGLGALHGLSRDERRTIAASWGTPDRNIDAEPSSAVSVNTSQIQFIDGLPGPMLRDVLKASGCHRRLGFTTAAVTYGTDGRPTTITTEDDLGKCQPVVGALLALTRSGVPRRISVAVPLDKSVPTGFARRPVHQPRYPPAAWSAPHPADALPDVLKGGDAPEVDARTRSQAQGNVEFEVVIDEDGEVAELHLVQGAGNGVNSSAASAVLQFRFSPPLANGQPVPMRAPLRMRIDLR
jgi:TonB family protein